MWVMHPERSLMYVSLLMLALLDPSAHFFYLLSCYVMSVCGAKVEIWAEAVQLRRALKLPKCLKARRRVKRHSPTLAMHRSDAMGMGKTLSMKMTMTQAWWSSHNHGKGSFYKTSPSELPWTWRCDKLALVLCWLPFRIGIWYALSSAQGLSMPEPGS